MAVGVDRVCHAGRRRAAIGGRPGRAEALTRVPAVVGAGLPEVDLLPGDLAHVVDEEASRRRVRVDREPERVAQAPGKRLLAAVAGGGAARHVAARRAGALPRVAGRDRPVPRDPQDLAEQDMPVAGSVVQLEAAAVGRVVAAAVARGHVQQAVLAELQVGADVVALRRGDVVDQDGLGGGIHRVVVAQHEARHAVDRRVRVVVLAAVLHERVVEVDEAVALELRVDGNRHQAALAVGADPGADVERRARVQRPVLVHAHDARLLGDQQPAAGDEGERRGLVRVRHEGVLEVGGKRDRICPSGAEQHDGEQREGIARPAILRGAPATVVASRIAPVRALRPGSPAE